MEEQIEGEKAMDEQLRLWCAVYGKGAVFSVKVPRDVTVSDLQEAILLKTRYGERFTIAASNLTLYLARSPDGAWLKDDDHAESFLAKGEIDAQYEEMHPLWKLTDPKLLGPNFQPGKEEIQVLAQLPDSTGEPTETALAKMAEDIRVLRELGERQNNKRKRYEHSKASSGEGRQLLQELRIHVEPLRVVPAAAAGDAAAVEPFDWEDNILDQDGRSIPLDEEQQRGR